MPFSCVSCPKKGGGMTQKGGFLCQNMPTNDVFFLPFGILEDVKMTFKKALKFLGLYENGFSAVFA